MKKPIPGSIKLKAQTQDQIETALAKEHLQYLAFDNSSLPNIISVVSNGNIVVANKAAAELLGYTIEALITKSRIEIFDINEISFKKMLKQRKENGHSEADVSLIAKSGKSIPCSITSAVFIDDNGVEKAITTISNRTASIKKQEDIDAIKDKIVADNILIAKAFQVQQDDWKKYISINSYDVMWDWNIETNQIYVGGSIEEIFGYVAFENKIMLNDFLLCLLAEERVSVQARLMKAVEGTKKNWNDTFMVERKDGSLAYTNSRASIIRDKTGKALHLLGATKDITKLHDLNEVLQKQNSLRQEQQKIFQLASKLSYDGIWDWNLLTNEFFLGEGFEELFGYDLNKTENHILEWSDRIHPEDKPAVETSLANAIASSVMFWEQAYRFVRIDGKVSSVSARASILRNENGKAIRMIGVVHNLTRQTEQQERLYDEIVNKEQQFKEYRDSFKLLFNTTSVVFYEVDLIANEVLLSDSYEKAFGYKIKAHMKPEEIWATHIHPDDYDLVYGDYLRMISSQENEWKCTYRFLRADHSVANVVSTRIIFRNADGKAYRMIGSMQDISEQTGVEQRLEEEIRLKEWQIAEAISEARETERSDIGKELHDNVNQLLGASKLYLELAKQGGEDSEMYLGRSSEFTMTAIEEIRKLTRGLTTDVVDAIGIKEAIEKIARDSMETTSTKINCNTKAFNENSVGEKFKLNLYRIVQEQLSNIIKHAASANVNIVLKQNKTAVQLKISDDGVGFDSLKSPKGIGLMNIKVRAQNFGGTASFVTGIGKGCVLQVDFPLSELLIK